MGEHWSVRVLFVCFFLTLSFCAGADVCVCVCVYICVCVGGWVCGWLSVSPRLRLSVLNGVYPVAPCQLTPTLTCVEPDPSSMLFGDDGEEIGCTRLLAHWGYDNIGGDTVSIPVGNDNSFAPAPAGVFSPFL